MGDRAPGALLPLLSPRIKEDRTPRAAGECGHVTSGPRDYEASFIYAILFEPLRWRVAFPGAHAACFRGEVCATAAPALLDTGQPTWVSIAQFYEEEDSGSSRSSSRLAQLAVFVIVVLVFSTRGSGSFYVSDC
jgi:hypothetical protein